MTKTPLNDALARQYEAWIYPRPVADLAALPADQQDCSDPAAHRELFWPDGSAPERPDILSAGCGANQAALLAFRNPAARVTGIDVSPTALAHQQRLKLQHNLTNLELQRMPIEAAATLGRSFDLVACTGVLHHLSDPLQGARVLGDLLKPDGVMVVMLYAKHGRAGIEMLQQMFGRLGLGRDAGSLAVVREVLARIPRTHPALALCEGAEDVTHDGGLVDLFLNARERSYSVPDCLSLVDEAGLAFQGWFDNAQYYPDLWFGAGSETYRRITALPEPEIWAAMELALAAEIDRHVFVACRRDRPAPRYRIDFSGPGFAGSVPLWIRGWGFSEREGGGRGGQPGLMREGMFIPLGEREAAMARGVDGRSPVRALAASGGEALARDFFRTLWRAGMIWMRT